MNAIEALAARIQTLPEAVRWLHAQSDVIHALGSGRPPHRGPKTKLVDSMLAVAAIIGAARVSAAMGNLAVLIFLYFKQYTIRRVGQPKGILLVGINALREPVLAQHLEKSYGQPVWQLDERYLVSFAKYRRLSLIGLLREWAALWRNIWPHLTSANTSGGLPLKYCLAHLTTVGPSFIYLRQWFRCHLGEEIANSRVIGFTSASVVSYAAVSVGVKAIYLIHGFQRRSLVFPQFLEVHCSNQFEADHFRARLPSAIVSIIPETGRILETRRIAVIASDYGDDHELDRCRTFIEWARQIKLPIVVRQHPAYRGSYWDQWRDVDGVEISEKACDIDTFLKEMRPRLLATWFSTTIHDAVMNGVIPVTFVQDNFQIDNIVYPIRKMAINWPAQKAILASMVDDRSRSSAFVAKLLTTITEDHKRDTINNMADARAEN
jgi:hypothetical protein